MPRNFNITRNEGEWYNTQVEDSYGNKYQNYFEHAHEASNWIYYIWENEDWYENTNEADLLANAIWGCTKLDKKLGLLKGNRDGLD